MNYELFFVYLRMRLMKNILLLLALMPLGVWAQTFAPYALATDVEGNETVYDYMGDINIDFGDAKEAPYHVEFHANGTDVEKNSVNYHWNIKVDTTMTDSPELAYSVLSWDLPTDSVIAYDFKMKGTFYVVFHVGKIVVDSKGHEYEECVFPTGADSIVFKFSLTGSELSFPNTFIPDDPSGAYSTFKAKSFKSIVDFHAAVFNRWGQKLYSWDDVEGGWDGKIGGSYAHNGAYYLIVNAKGSEGRIYNIKKTINVLKYTQEESSTGGDN